MPATRISLEQFLELSAQHPVIDVRSPGEFTHAHIPRAVSLPLFSDEERKVVGTTYKQVSREEAIKIGLDYFGPKMRTMVEFAESLVNTTIHQGSTKKTVLVHCWRGGMRSGAVAWLLDLYGFKVYLLDGGYKSFRTWVLAQFLKDYNFRLIGGYTGSGKTLVLHELKKQGHATVDLEGIANHKGSAFGGLDKTGQPATEMFENVLAVELYQLTKTEPAITIWVEDESQRIGDLNMPAELWNRFRQKPLFFLNIPFEQRLAYIVKEYGVHTKEGLLNAIMRIQKRLGGLETKTAVNCLLENDIRGCFEVLLKYYDKHYGKALHNRPQLKEVIQNIEAPDVDAMANTQKILSTVYERGTATTGS
jgi:tRNA 2-selenouridine synthase